MVSWDPAQYARYDGERGRPFADLMARVGAEQPGLVLDLGCGHGPLTMTLLDRWPRARVVGVDSSAAMLERARALDAAGRVEWVQADVRELDLSSFGAEPDVVVSNATLQWVPGHLDLLPRWVSALAPGGWFALQVPGNFEAPSHALLRETAQESPRAADLVPALLRPPVDSAAAYLTAFSAAGCAVDAWETTYLHVLDPQGELDSPVLEWAKGTALRPVLDLLLAPAEREDFLIRYAAKLAPAYPRQAIGTVLPFRRLFAVARRRPAGR